MCWTWTNLSMSGVDLDDNETIIVKMYYDVCVKVCDIWMLVLFK